MATAETLKLQDAAQAQTDTQPDVAHRDNPLGDKQVIKQAAKRADLPNLPSDLTGSQLLQRVSPSTPSVSREPTANFSPSSSEQTATADDALDLADIAAQKRQQDPFMKGLPPEFDPDNPPDKGPWVIYDEGPPEPPNDAERLETVHLMGLLDAPEDPVLNSICDLACSVFKCVVSGISVVDKHRLWYHAMGGPIPRVQHHRSLSFCGWNMLPNFPETLIVEDTYLDRRFQSCPTILDPQPPGTPAVRFYAGAPLVCSNGHRLGSMCIVDMQPRKVTAEQMLMLANFAEMAVRYIEKDHYLQMQKMTNQRLLRSMDCFTEAMLLLDVSEAGWKVLYANEAWESVTNVPKDDLVQRPLLEVCHPEGETAAAMLDRVREPIACGKGFVIRIQAGDVTLRLRCRAAGKEYYSDKMSQPIGVPSFVDTGTEALTLFFAVVIPDAGAVPASVTPTETASSKSGSAPSSIKGPPENQEYLQADKGVLVKANTFAIGFPEASLGILVRATPQGRIYRGSWHSSAVAIKVSELFQSECVPVGRSGYYAPAEATASVQLSHPQLVRSYKYAVLTRPAPTTPTGQPWVECWLVREWCSRGCLTDAIMKGFLQSDPNTKSGPDEVAVLATAAEVASALTYLHGQGYLHGDLTGDCVWLADAGTQRGFTARLADYGAHRPHTTTDENFVACKRTSHAAPELLEEGKLSKASDVYALGVLIWEMFAQNRMYAGLKLQEMRALITGRKPVPKIPAELPADIQALTDRCMAANPQDRPDAATVRRSLVKLLRNYQGSEGALLDSTTLDPGEGDLQKNKTRQSGCNPLVLIRNCFAGRKAEDTPAPAA